MDFSFTTEQDDLRRTVRQVGERWERSDTDFDPKLWEVLTGQLGLAALAVPEAQGGLDASWVEVAVALDEVGAALLPVPLLSVVVAASALGDDPALADVAAGSRVAAFVTGVGGHVLDGAVAQVFVALADDGVYAVDATDAKVEPLAPLDQTRGQARVALDRSRARKVGDAAASARALDLARVALAVESVGGARHCLDMTVDFLKTRVQFGRVIGSFQALKHRAADLAVELEAATATAYYAAWAASSAPDELPVVAPLAKAVCTSAYLHIAAETIQLHGGIGFTWEHDAHRYFKRATTNAAFLGDAATHRRLVADRAGLGQ